MPEYIKTSQVDKDAIIRKCDSIKRWMQYNHNSTNEEVVKVLVNDLKKDLVVLVRHYNQRIAEEKRINPKNISRFMNFVMKDMAEIKTAVDDVKVGIFDEVLGEVAYEN